MTYGKKDAWLNKKIIWNDLDFDQIQHSHDRWTFAKKCELHQLQDQDTIGQLLNKNRQTLEKDLL